jgi:hypothetical protein
MSKPQALGLEITAAVGIACDSDHSPHSVSIAVDEEEAEAVAMFIRQN